MALRFHRPSERVMARALGTTVAWLLAVAAIPSVTRGGAPVEQIFRSDTFKFRMTYPAGWKEREKKDLSVLTSREKDGVSVNVTANTIPRGEENSVDLDSFTKDRVAAALSREEPPSDLISFERQFIDAAPAIVIVSARMRASDSEVRVQSVQYIVTKDDFIYVITGTAAEDRFSDSFLEIQRIVGSFKFEK